MIQKEILDKLEFYKVLAFVARYCVTTTGKKITESIRPFINSKAQEEGFLVTQAKEILIRASNPPFENLPDLYEDLSLSRIDGGLLTASKLLHIYRLAVCSRNLATFLKSNRTFAPDLAVYADNLFVDKVFEHHITRILDENGEVKDSASKELARIRHDINERNFELRKLVNRISKDLSEKDLIQEDYLTLRDGRIVIPIKAEHKRHIKGFIHSESSSGQTVYIEPEETLHLNNEIITLSFAERREIERLLKELTKKVGEISLQLHNSLEIISVLDSFFARAQYSIEIIGSFPSVENAQPLNLRDARHPLLLHKFGREKSIPLNLTIDQDKVIIITGPNAGGKTVVLKTVGLLTLMVFSGIHIPASPDSNFHYFSNVFVDIGDQQSIEDDLSTFSSHLSNIQKILENSNSSTLVLLDELGTGTDPSAGSALGTAVLLTLCETGSTVLASTHHGNLKTIAHSQPGFQNAAMQFDTEKLEPTYAFRQGLPGSSYAFEIASRLGFTPEFIHLAQQYQQTDERNLEKVLIGIEKKEHELKEKLHVYEIENSRLKGLSSVYEKRIAKLEFEKHQILKKAKDEAEQFLSTANREVERAIKEVKESQASKSAVKDAKAIVDSFKLQTKELITEEIRPSEVLHSVQIGATVKIKDTGTIGKVTHFDRERKSVKILSGNMPITVKLDRIEFVGKQEVKELTHLHTEVFHNQYRYQIDLRGKRPEEAELEIIRFVDDAYSNGQDRIEILHGKGTGALKKLVQSILKDHIGVNKYYFAPVEYGGEGITIIEMKS